MKRLTKGDAFRLGLAAVLTLVALVAWRLPTALGEAVSGALFAVVSLVGLFSGANVGDNWVKGVHYNPNLEGK